MRLTIDSRLQLAAIVLAEELHFGLAAQKLHVAVSTLSKQIAQLEEKLGLKLFNRSSKGVELTDAGRAYVEETRSSLLHAEKAINAARAANGGKDYILTADHSPYADLVLVLMLLTVRLPLYPRIKVQLHSDFSLDLVHSLLAGEIDLAIVTWPPQMPTLTLVDIGSAPLYVVPPKITQWRLRKNSRSQTSPKTVGSCSHGKLMRCCTTPFKRGHSVLDLSQRTFTIFRQPKKPPTWFSNMPVSRFSQRPQR